MIIGQFNTEPNGSLIGFIPFLRPEGAQITVIPVNTQSAFDHILTLPEYQNIEIGRGQTRKPNGGHKLIAVMLDTPSLAEPLQCKLIEKGEGRHDLVWSRDKTTERAERILAFYAELDRYHPKSDSLVRLLQTLYRYCDETGRSFDDHISKARWMATEPDSVEIPF